MNINSQFEYLIHPISKEEFFKNYFEKNYLLIQNRAKDYYDRVLNIADIDSVLTSKQIPVSNIQMSKKAPISHDAWSKLVRFKGIHVDLEKIASGLDNGNSLILNNFNKYQSKLGAFVNQLQEEILSGLWTNIYITPTSFQAFKRHYDTHDVFVLQIKGEKHWKLYDTPLELPHQTQSNKKFKFDLEHMTPIKEILLKEGDMLYIPRGMVHEAIATDTLSIHITLGSTPPLVGDLINSFTSKALEDSFFRKSIPTDINQMNSLDEEEFKSKLIELIKQTSLTEIIDKTKENFIDKHFKKSEKGRILQNYIQRDEINLDSRIGKFEKKKYEIIMKGISVILKADNKEENFPFFVKPLIDAVLNSNENGVELKSINSTFKEEDLIKTFKHFVKAGFFKVV